MCLNPCSTCLTNKFYLCTGCQSNQLYLKNNLCIKDPLFLIQIVCTFLLILFFIPNLMRKRSVTLMRVFDAIQIVSYFKYINGYIQNRQVFLYLGMRAWGDWSEGWNLISNNNDISLPIWTNQQTILNKIIRIGIIWGGIITVMLIMGVLKTMMGDSQVDFSKFVQKNLPNAVSLGFYINIQDMGLVMANAFNYSLTYSLFSNSMITIQFIFGIVFAIIFIALVVWIFYRINFDYIKQLQNTPQKIYPHVYMFMFALDYDIFPSYQLTNLPQKQKKIYRYSNIRIIQILKKVAYSFLIISSLYDGSQSLTGEVFSILGLIIFFDIIWYVSLPYDVKKQKFQLIISVMADIITIVILLYPLFLTSQMILLILCLSLFGLAITSLVIQYYMEVYNIIPVDLYETGLSVIIEDKRLLKQIQQRKRMQQQNQRLMRQMQQQNKLLKEQLQARKQNKSKLKDQSQQSLPNIHPKEEKNKFDSQFNDKNIDDQLIYEGNQQLQQKTSMNSEDLAQLYKIDEQKRRKIYQFNKKAQFTYSNKVQL